MCRAVATPSARSENSAARRVTSTSRSRSVGASSGSTRSARSYHFSKPRRSATITLPCTNRNRVIWSTLRSRVQPVDSQSTTASPARSLSRRSPTPEVRQDRSPQLRVLLDPARDPPAVVLVPRRVVPHLVAVDRQVLGEDDRRRVCPVLEHRAVAVDDPLEVRGSEGRQARAGTRSGLRATTEIGSSCTHRIERATSRTFAGEERGPAREPLLHDREAARVGELDRPERRHHSVRRVASRCPT